MKALVKALFRAILFVLGIAIGCVIYNVIVHFFGSTGEIVLLAIAFVCLIVVYYIKEKEE